jgi:hypothetical protein
MNLVLVTVSLVSLIGGAVWAWLRLQTAQTAQSEQSVHHAAPDVALLPGGSYIGEDGAQIEIRCMGGPVSVGGPLPVSVPHEISLYPDSNKSRAGTTTFVSGGFGGICLVIADSLSAPYGSWLRFATPWLTALAAAVWPNFWERFKWWRARRQGINTLEQLISDLRELRPHINDDEARKEADRVLKNLESELVRIHSARPMMDLTIKTTEAAEKG